MTEDYGGIPRPKYLSTGDPTVGGGGSAMVSRALWLVAQLLHLLECGARKPS